MTYLCNRSLNPVGSALILIPLLLWGPAKAQEAAAVATQIDGSTTTNSQAINTLAPPYAADRAADIALPAKETLTRMRETYREAREALADKDQTRFATALKLLEDYPLQPYLVYEQHLQQLDQLDRATLETFRKEYSYTPLPRRLHRHWLSNLAAEERWQGLVDNYDPALAGTGLRCQKLWADYQLGQRSEALSQVPDLWVVGVSQPRSCDALFKAWIDAGEQTEDHAWERFWLALERNRPRLARYLVRFLEDKERVQLAETALGLHRHPERLTATTLPEDNRVYPRLVIHTLKRLGRQDGPAALGLLGTMQKELKLSDDELFRIQRRMGLRMLRSYHPESETWLRRIDSGYQDLELLEWRIRFQLRQGDWEGAGELLEKLPAKERFEDRWRYWQARILDNETRDGATQKAEEIYQELANERSFYGFLASHRLGRGYSLNNRSSDTDHHALTRLAQDPALVRARELVYHNQLTQARREWDLATADFSREQHYLAAKLARRWGWYEQGIRSAIAAREWDDLLIRFPSPYSREVLDYASRFKIDTSWVLAVARQESAFMPDARSHAGAVGLMQLMPATAKQTARSVELSYQGPHQLTDPDINIHLGSAYLAKMLKRYEGNRVLATAAYNAGPGRVSRWLRERGELPVDVWIETIPFDETRRYVQNVLSYSVIYGDLLGFGKEFLKPAEARPPAASLEPRASG
ncbi:transglycosylase SLT domain-containing protein [Motiliproteus sp. SC1-56]|uniref:transglycosylase SLT domain-containing protein n=1 Tax=Motiliproteus sp. SC1-56 TaxID=2799565 RepID=UPI001A8F3DD8|nr:transglycosylase SLT domain-containing protein [Motiliproteus sp. SC1-56]